MRAKILLAALTATLGVVSTYGSGFSLYEPSVISHAMGGALVGKAMDASANFNNPATLTDLTNTVVSVGFVTEHPRGTVRVKNASHVGEHKMEPGMFTLPHFQLAIPLPYDFAFGLSASAEYGLGTKYARDWVMRWNSVETTVEGLVINPNIAYKITDKWSIGAGIRWLYFDFEQNMYPAIRNPYTGAMAGRFKSHLHGNNGFSDIGYQIGTKYDITDTFSVGAVWKTQIDSTIEGKSRVEQMEVYPGAYNDAVMNAASKVDGDADAELRLPQSIAGGFNWDITPKWHLGGALSWTEWSTIDTLDFNLNGISQPKKLDWHDTWRVSGGLAYDFADDWTAMVSYVYDMDCTDNHQCSVMLPPADRHIASAGLVWRAWQGLEFALSYSCVFMHGWYMECEDEKGGTGTWRVTTSRGFCHAAGFSVTYRF